MGQIYVTSDLHFCHNRGFLYTPRGFNSIEEANETIVKNYNSVVNPDDEIYLLGDLMLNDNEKGMELLKQLKGKIHIVFGNHDTDTRKNLYKTLPNVVEVGDALRFKYCGYHFYCSHYPTLTGNLEKESLKKMEINLFGHTHQKDEFYEDRPYMFHVGLDSNNNYPVNIKTIIEKCENKVKECLEML